MLQFTYKNHRGQIATRRVVPVALEYNPVPNPDYGYQPGWFLYALDYTGDRLGVGRSFALSHIQLPTNLFREPRNDRPYRMIFSGKWNANLGVGDDPMKSALFQLLSSGMKDTDALKVVACVSQVSQVFDALEHWARDELAKRGKGHD